MFRLKCLRYYLKKIEVKNLESLKEFTEQFRSFKDTAASLISNEENLITLFAIFRKDARTEKIQPKNNGDQPATEKQKRFVKSLLKGKPIADTLDVEKMTKKEASDWITKLRSE